MDQDKNLLDKLKRIEQEANQMDAQAANESAATADAAPQTDAAPITETPVTPEIPAEAPAPAVEPEQIPATLEESREEKSVAPVEAQETAEPEPTIAEEVTEEPTEAAVSMSTPDRPHSDRIPDCAKPDVHEEKNVGEGMTKKEAMKIRMQSMNKQEIAYLRRKMIFEKCWPVFRFLILFGLGFVILTPLMFMLSYAFRDSKDMNDPTVMWIPRNFTLTVMKQTIDAMGLTNGFFDNNPLVNTLFLNIGCSICQVITCALTGYGFARFKFKGRNLLFGIVVLMIVVPTQIISIPLYMTFKNFMFGTINLIDSMWAMYLPAMTANGIRAGLMIFIFRQFFRGLPKELEDAAYLDGCGPFKTFLKVMVPNAGSSFLTVFLFSIVWYWNDYYVSSAFFTNTKTIALVLKNLDTTLNLAIFNNANAQVSVREKIVWLEAGCLISITPMLILYACLQKHFTEGIERSGLVG